MLALRMFIDAWWHAFDIETAIYELQRSFSVLGLPPADFPALLIRARTAEFEDDEEEVVRRHQIGILACAANMVFLREAAPQRIVALGESARWELDEPAWVIVDNEETGLALLAQHGPAPQLEAAYGAARSPNAVGVTSEA